MSGASKAAPGIKKTKPGNTGRINPATPTRINTIPTDILATLLSMFSM
jgi:hypothetical protein